MKMIKCTAFLIALAAVELALGQSDRERVTFVIEEQPLRSALTVFAKQAQLQILRRDEEVSLKGKNAPAIKGELLPGEALERLLADTGLLFEFINKRTVRIAPAKPSQGEISSSDPQEASQGSAREELAQSASSAPGVSVAGESEAGRGSEPDVMEIIVTAQKREERLQDVPVPVAVINAQALADNNKVLLRDYIASVPGVTLAAGGTTGIQTIAIRGITTGFSNPTVAVLIDGVNFTQSTNAGGGKIVPEIDPGDLARIEVLRGPQGTLFGANSLGGLLNYVTADPSTSEFSGRIQAGISSVENGGGMGYNLRGAVNMPLSDSLAVRGSAFSREDPGFIDNVFLGDKAVNSVDAYGGRFSVSWEPSEDFSVRLNALNQRLEGDGSPMVDIPTAANGFGDLEQSRIQGSGTYSRQTEQYSAVLTAKLGNVELTSLTGYGINTMHSSEDNTSQFGGLTVLDWTDAEMKKFTQELRVDVPLGETFKWLVGAYYTDEDADLRFRGPVIDPVSGAISDTFGILFDAGTPITYSEYAAFTAITVFLSERLDVQLGARASEFEQTSAVTLSGVEVPGLTLDTEADAVTYLFTPRFKVTDDLMLYSRIATGFRVDGPNAFPGNDVLPTYEPDKTVNYEVGLKGAFFDDMLTLDASLYHVKWENIQFGARGRNGLGMDNGSYFTNGGAAKSQGLELSLELRPHDGLTLAGWVALGDSELTESFPASSDALGLSGDWLPYSTRRSGYLSAQQEFLLWANVEGFVGMAANYVGDRLGLFTGNGVRQRYPAYTQVDLSAGMKREGWSLNLFVTNLGDKRGQLADGPAADWRSIITPRTIGMSVAKAF